MDVTPKGINEKQFRDAWRGYNQEEVDDFLDQIAEAVDAAQRDNEMLRERNLELEQALSGTREAEEMLKKTLVTAQRAAEEAIAKAKEKADQLVAEAEKRAAGANESARKIIDEAESEARRRTIDIEKQAVERRHDLDDAISHLSSFQSELQEKLRTFLEMQKEALEALVTDESSTTATPVGNGNVSASRFTTSEPSRDIYETGPAESEPIEEARVVHVDAVDEAAPTARRGVKGLFFREES
jgi:cell division initiation protein